MPANPSTIPTSEPTPNSHTMLTISEAIARPLVSALSSSPGMNRPRPCPEVGPLASSCRGRLALVRARVGRGLTLVAERQADQPSQLDALGGAQRREHLVLHSLHSLLRALERSHAGRRELDDVSPAIIEVAAALRKPGALDLVQHQHQVVRIQVERSAERLLGDGASVVGEVA